MDKTEVNEIMSEHLKLLAESAEECKEENLLQITQAMVATSAFIIQLEQDV